MFIIMTKNDKNIVINIKSRTVVRILLLVVITLAGLAFFHQISKPLLLIFISFFFALALNPAVSWIAHRLKSKSRTLATGVAYVVVVTFLVGFFALVFPP